MRNVAENILSALSLIPDILSTASRLLNIFKDNSVLLEKSDALYMSILTAMGHILEYLRRRSIRKVLQVTFQQQSFERELMEKVTDMTKARDSFNVECETCYQEVSEKSRQHSAQSARELAATLEICRIEQQRSHQAMMEGLQSFSDSYAALNSGLKKLHRELVPLKPLMEMLRANPNLLANAFWMSGWPAAILKVSHD